MGDTTSALFNLFVALLFTSAHRHNA